METIQLRTLLQEQFAKMTEGQAILFEAKVDKDELYNKYLDSFPEGTNEIYKERREYDCNSCKQFIKRVGAIVVLDNGKKRTIWDVTTEDAKFQPVVKALEEFVKSAPIGDVFSIEPKFSQAGMPHSPVMQDDGTVITFNHLHIKLPKKFINYSNKSDATIKGDYRSAKDVFKRSLEEISENSVRTILELSKQGSLYKGNEWIDLLESFLQHKSVYQQLETEAQKDLYAWEQSVKSGGALTRIRNHSIGTLLVDLSTGVDLETAVTKYEKIVAPTNYKRSKGLFTEKQKQEAQKFILDNGYADSLARRHATLDDINVNNILFSNKDSAKRIKGALDVFDTMSATAPKKAMNFSNVAEITIKDFLSSVLPTATSIEAYVENKHSKNFVSLIAPENKKAKPMFKWDNPFSIAYTGNITDSMLKENVKNAGGKVDGFLRFSIQWNDEERDNSDLDAHCVEANGNEIYYGNKGYVSRLGGMLDVDIINPKAGTPAVENIIYTDSSKMQYGTYKFFVHGFSSHNSRGFKAEIEMDGQTYSFIYPHAVRRKESVQVATVTYSKDGLSIKEHIPSSSVQGKEVWNIKTNEFVPVTVVMKSPNYWDGANGTGNEHVMFMLDGCVNPEKPNAFFNEFLKEEFKDHRQVMEALGGKLAVTNADDQLSGLGFSATQRNELVVKVKGFTERLLKIKF